MLRTPCTIRVQIVVYPSQLVDVRQGITSLGSRASRVRLASTAQPQLEARRLNRFAQNVSQAHTGNSLGLPLLWKDVLCATRAGLVLRQGKETKRSLALGNAARDAGVRSLDFMRTHSVNYVQLGAPLGMRTQRLRAICAPKENLAQRQVNRRAPGGAAQGAGAISET